MTSPTSMRAPSAMLSIAPAGSAYWAGISVPGRVSSFPSSSTRSTVGRRSAPAALRCFTSSTWRLSKPVSSSNWRCTDTPSTTSRNCTWPATSLMTGWVCGSQFATTWPGSTCPPSTTESTVPYGTLCRSRSRPLASRTANSPDRETATWVPSARATRRTFWSRTVPPTLTEMLSAVASREAAPPMWNVRMVSCVPGSPIDWAATTPTDSPWFTISPRARSRP